MGRCGCWPGRPSRRHSVRRLFLIAWLLACLAFLISVAEWLRRYSSPKRRRKRPLDRGACRPIPRPVYRRPDPMIYCQKYLMDQGLAVTWDNPDIHLERGGTPVPSWELHPNTEYDVIARIWNGSNEAPAVNMPVRYSYLDFGIGGVSVPIGQTTVDLPVNGAPGCPAFATMKWTTPKTPGHYCLQVELIWPDDANPQNNLGQENTDVIALNSPRGRIAIPVRNAGRRRQALRLEADTYALPRARPCDEPPAESSVMSDEEVARHKRDAMATHDRAHFPVPQGWEVGIEPREVAPEPGEAAEVVVDVTAPDGFVGRQPLNVLAFDGPSLVGGVTLYVEGTG